MKKTLALVLAVLMLCSVVVIATSAEEATDWEALYAKYGVNIYIGAPTDTPPVLDGTISTGEYTFERDLEYANLWESAPGEIQSGVKECYAHDANYIYYASTFTQKNDNRAFWVQWKPTNTFDVFRDDSDLKTYYYNRISLQLRWRETDGVFGLQPYGSWSWTRPETPIAFPTNGLAGGDTEYEYQYAASKITDEAAEVYTKTYEVRIAKSYIATVAQCSVDDVRVVPYWTYFHANLQNAAPLSTELVIEITETDFTCYVPGDKSTYWFLVCDEAPEGYEPSKGQTTAPATTETPTTEGAGDATTAPATTAAPTTAATTTAAPTTTAKATTAAATTAAATTVAAEEGGCKGSIAITALAVLPTLAGGALLLKRRKED
jgi:hypothetical protein